jgi:hypothetical protein
MFRLGNNLQVIAICITIIVTITNNEAAAQTYNSLPVAPQLPPTNISQIASYPTNLQHFLKTNTIHAVTLQQPPFMIINSNSSTAGTGTGTGSATTPMYSGLLVDLFDLIISNINSYGFNFTYEIYVVPDKTFGDLFTINGTKTWTGAAVNEI